MTNSAITISINLNTNNNEYQKSQISRDYVVVVEKIAEG